MAGYESAAGFAWLYSVLSGDSTLTGYAPGGVWRGLAPDGTATPFVILSLQSGQDKLTANAVRILDDDTFLVKASGPASNTAGVTNAAARIDALLGRTSGTIGTPGQVTAGAILACYRETPLSVDELINGELWTNLGGLYRLIIQAM
jgi:hypothetical protein